MVRHFCPQIPKSSFTSFRDIDVTPEPLFLLTTVQKCFGNICFYKGAGIKSEIIVLFIKDNDFSSTYHQFLLRILRRLFSIEQNI